MNHVTESKLNTPTMDVQGAKLNTNVIETLKILQDRGRGYSASYIKALDDVMEYLIRNAFQQGILSCSTLVGYLRMLVDIRTDIESLALCYRHKE